MKPSAIGNMNVNARGDEIDPAGNITKTREQIMREYNELNTMVPTDDSIPEGTGITADDDWKDWEPKNSGNTIHIHNPEIISHINHTGVRNRAY